MQDPFNGLLGSIQLLLSVLGAGLMVTFTILLILLLTKKNPMDKVRIVNTFFRIEKWPLAVTLGLFFLYATFPFEETGDETLTKKILTIAFIASLTWFLFKLVSVIKQVIVTKFSIETVDNLEARKIQTQFQYIQTVFSIIIVIFGIGLILWQFEQLRVVSTGILASAGLITIVIAFAANQTLSNLIAGFQIAFTQPFRIDDVVIVEGEWGRIEEIKLTYVVVRIWDQRRLVLPITYFINKPFQNWTRTSADILGTITLYLDYRVPVENIREELKKIVETTELWDKKVVGLQVTDTSEKTITVRALVSAANASNAWDLRCYVREKLVNFLQDKYPESLPRIRVEEGPLSKSGERTTRLKTDPAKID
jgi:small-conductance mechanosensitive channel